MALSPLRQFRLFKSMNRDYRHHQMCKRGMKLSLNLNKNSNMDEKDSNELAIQEKSPKEKLMKSFPNHYRDGNFISRMSYVEFIDEALGKLKELGIDKDLNAYKELLRVFPPGKFHPRNTRDFGLFHAPQQLAAVRVLHQMQMNGLKPDKDFEMIVVDAFSKRSDTWVKVARMNYWSMKGRNIDQYPLPEATQLPKEPHQLAKLAIMRMLDDQKSIITVTNTSRALNSVDKTWLVYSQNETQKAIIEKLADESTLYIEQGGFTYVGKDHLTYYYLKYYVDEETQAIKSKPQQADYNFNTLKVKFFGSPIKQRYIEIEDKEYVDGSYILGIVATGTSSQDSLLSWLKILQERNPKLGKLNVVFKMSRPSPEIVAYEGESIGDDDQHSTKAVRK